MTNMDDELVIKRRRVIRTELFSGNHPPWITDDNMMLRMRVLSVMRGYAQQVKERGGWQWYDDEEVDNMTIYRVDHMMRSWYYRDCPARNVHDANIATMDVDLTVPDMPFPSSSYYAQHGVSTDPKTGLPFPGGSVFLRLFVRWRQNILKGRFEDGIYDNYASTHVPSVSTRYFKPLELHERGCDMLYMPLSTAMAGNSDPLKGYYTGGLSYGWFYQHLKYMPNVSSVTDSRHLPGKRYFVWSSSQLNAWKAMMSAVTGQLNPYYVYKL